MEAVHFKTDDAVLAQSLYNAGVPEFLPPTNTFTEQILKRLGYRGVPLIEAARAAWKKSDRGRVEYHFERTPELPHFLRCYSEQQSEISADGVPVDAGESLRAIMAKAASGEMDEREALLRITCVNGKCRIQFVNRWKELPARLEIQDPGEAVTVGDRTSHPGGKNISLAMSDEKLKELGL